MEALALNFHTVSIEATLLAAGTIVIIVLFRGISIRIPGAIVAMVLGTIVVEVFKLPVATIATRFGGIPSGLPHFEIPTFRPTSFTACSAPRSPSPCWAQSNR